MRRVWLLGLTCLVGLLISGTALFATTLGLDHNAHWGKGRVFLFIVGIALVVISLSLALLPDQVLKNFRNRLSHGKNLTSLWLQKFPLLKYFAESRPRQVYLLGCLIVIFSLITYTWYASVGRWTDWPESTDYYDQLASSFQHGKLWLEEEPSPELLSLPNPYDYSARKSANISFLWDATLYQGKYYLYWGPMPALILAFIKSIFPLRIGDQYLVFGFLAGMLIFTTLFIIKLWQRFYQQIPIFLVLIFILLAAFVCPLPWMLTHGAIYEATIAGGQFFLIAGLYIAYSSLETGKYSTPKLLLAGILWAFAAWSRTINIIPAGFLTFMVMLWWILKEHKGRDNLYHVLPKLLILALPLLLGIIGISWYNWARFGSISETGLRYTLTFTNLNETTARPFSASYLVSNLGMYLFTPAKMQRAFPFVLPLTGQVPPFLSSFVSEHHTEELTGLLVCAPFSILAIFSIIKAGSLFSRTFNKKSIKSTGTEDGLLLWILVSLIGITLLSFSILLLYFNVTMRFFAEFMPGLVILSAVGFWQGSIWLQKNAFVQKLYIIFSLLLVVSSILISLLLAITGYYNSFQRMNPHLFKLLSQFFRW